MRFLWNWIARRYPGLKFVREYSPKTADRREILRKIMNFVRENNLGDGDYLEFGVYKAGNFVEAIKAAGNKRLDKMRFHAFDSFEGLPDPKGDDKYSEQWTKGQVAFGEQKFRKNLEKGGAPMDRVTITPGWFKDSLNNETGRKLNLKKASVIWVDCDLYESTVPVLKFIKDYVVDGTIIVFDDWYHFRGNPNYGEQKAFREWLAENPQFSASEYHKYFWHGNSFIIHKK